MVLTPPYPPPDEVTNGRALVDQIRVLLEQAERLADHLRIELDKAIQKAQREEQRR